MIRNFTEHSANERTFLAWIRTGIAVIAFGFVLEKFNLFILALTGTSATEVRQSIRTDRLGGPLGRYEGLALMLVGVALVAIAGLRFVRTKRLIDASDGATQADQARRFNVSQATISRLVNHELRTAARLWRASRAF
jgi:putative membrane protein